VKASEIKTQAPARTSLRQRRATRGCRGVCTTPCARFWGVLLPAGRSGASDTWLGGQGGSGSLCACRSICL